MKFKDIKLGDTLKLVGSEPDCIASHVKGTFEVLQDDDGKLYVRCMYGTHVLEPMCDSHGEIPELELAASVSTDPEAVNP